MYELVARMAPGQLIGLVAVTGGLLIGLVAVVMGIWLELRRAEMTLALKRDMLDRGMTPEEIQIVMEAGSKDSRRLSKSPVEPEV
jgi:hypothetical protein